MRGIVYEQGATQVYRATGKSTELNGEKECEASDTLQFSFGSIPITGKDRILLALTMAHRHDKLKERLIKWMRQLLGVRWPGSALTRLTCLARYS